MLPQECVISKAWPSMIKDIRKSYNMLKDSQDEKY